VVEFTLKKGRVGNYWHLNLFFLGIRVLPTTFQEKIPLGLGNKEGLVFINLRKVILETLNQEGNLPNLAKIPVKEDFQGI